MKKDVVITLPRDVATWLLCHCAGNLAELNLLLFENIDPELHELYRFDRKYFEYLYYGLKHCVSRREIEAHYESRPLPTFLEGV